MVGERAQLWNLRVYPSLSALLAAQMVKHLPTMWETRVRFLGWEDPLGKEMATHSSILAWKIPWTEDPGRLQSMGLQRVGHDWATSLHSLILLFQLPHLGKICYLNSIFFSNTHPWEFKTRNEESVVSKQKSKNTQISQNNQGAAA